MQVTATQRRCKSNNAASRARIKRDEKTQEGENDKGKSPRSKFNSTWILEAQFDRRPYLHEAGVRIYKLR